ncbi:four-carbon acid sugar kinase family protein [Agrococcus sp. ARC_14]|uniref:four-carbon acid sugar kinase family protein n=1 Tax=Agrococcus sp. ARC_14 TaxID=2919927 RepID=UPI001F066C6C|nr:four-carbon acid sugar kinase family protein [Agrococcus sp. ARC_14]MCH1881372.1 hypothetical protein [Agrococcus sp. ARC_14]
MPQLSTASTAAPVGIVADDLTGATDSAVQFARDGWQARLALTAASRVAIDPGSVAAVVTDARAQDAADARASTAQAVTALRDGGAQRLFVKIDSTMRGSVSAQARGAIEAWSVEHPGAFAIVCSAYPAMGRTVEHGRLLVHGEGVHTTAVGTDPVTPVSTSDLAVLLPGSSALHLPHGSAAEGALLLEQAAGSSDEGVVVVDAATDDDLARLAESIALVGPHAIPVGAAGLASAMSHAWSSSQPPAVERPQHANRVVVVVSSLHDVSRAQADHLVHSLPSERIRVLAPSLDEILGPDAVSTWAERELAQSPMLPEVVVIASPTARPAQAPGAPSSTALVAESLATITELVFEQVEVDAMLLLGGEGARTVLGRLGTASLLIRAAIREGIPIGSLEGGAADGITVVTKAGGFGDEASVTDIVLELLQP